MVPDTPAAAVGSRATTVVAEGLRVAYQGRTVLDVPTITLPPARTYALLGSSGAGKSTLLRVLGLLEAPTEGSVLYDGRRVAKSDLAARRRIAAVFQKPYLLRGTVEHNVGYGLKLRRVPQAKRRALVAQALATVGLSGWEERSAITLSGGEAQRVALARALVLQPNLLLLDEPLSYLDPLLKRELTREFAEILTSEHVTALYVTHDQDEAAVVADRMGVMRDGRILAEGDPQAVLTLPTDPWVASFLGTEMPVRGTVSSSSGGRITVRCGDSEIFAHADLPVGTSVHVGVRPEDVLVFEPGADIPRAPGRNTISAEMIEVVDAGVMVRVVVRVGDCRLAATVSQTSAASLTLDPGTTITLLFNASAVRIAQVCAPG